MSVKGWKKNMLAAQAERGKSMASLYRRVKLLCDVFADREFRQDNGNLDDAAACTLLSKELNDVASDFFVLRRVIEYFPDRDSWAGGNLQKMIAEVREYDHAQVEKEPKRTVERATMQQLRTEKERAASAEQQVARVEKTVDDLRVENQQLRDDNQQLREELATANGRIAELERLLDRHLGASVA